MTTALVKLFRACRWRRAVGLIAAYALAMQAFFAYGAVTQAAAAGQSSGTFFVICVNGGGSPADGAGSPAKAPTHCPICTLAADTAATVPEAVAVPAWQAALAEEFAFVAQDACITRHRPRLGLSRAPPQSA